MNASDIAELVAHLQARGLGGCELRQDGKTLRLRLGSGQPADAPTLRSDSPPAAQEAATTTVRAAHAGVLRTRHPLLAAAVEVAESGQAIGYLQIGQVLLAVAAPCAGRVTPLAQDGSLVGYGTPLFAIA